MPSFEIIKRSPVLPAARHQADPARAAGWLQHWMPAECSLATVQRSPMEHHSVHLAQQPAARARCPAERGLLITMCTCTTSPNAHAVASQPTLQQFTKMQATVCSSNSILLLLRVYVPFVRCTLKVGLHAEADVIFTVSDVLPCSTPRNSRCRKRSDQGSTMGWTCSSNQGWCSHLTCHVDGLAVRSCVLHCLCQETNAHLRQPCKGQR